MHVQPVIEDGDAMIDINVDPDEFSTLFFALTEYTDKINKDIATHNPKRSFEDLMFLHEIAANAHKMLFAMIDDFDPATLNIMRNMTQVP